MPTCTILKYDPQHCCHMVKDEQGRERLIDLMVDGGFPKETHPEDLTGTVVYDYEFPFVAIAMNVRKKESSDD